MSLSKEQFIEMLEGLSDNEVLNVKNTIIKYQAYRKEKSEAEKSIDKYKKEYEKYKYKFLDNMESDLDE